ncbi:MAG: hypothetical protein GXY67_10655 [Clostridiales bacterium]|nr:hypothetical protein [Clostridiales bacterium]
MSLITEHSAFGLLVWDIIGINADQSITGEANTLTVLMRNPPLWRSFDDASKNHPWGCNRWATSSVRRWLREEFLGGFSPEDRDVLRTVAKETFNADSKRMEEIPDVIFLLSASEAGFPVDNQWVMDEGRAYAFFASGEQRLRRKVDVDGDECYWWLRSPNPSNAVNVRYINPSGALYNNYASVSSGLAAACVIG